MADPDHPKTPERDEVKSSQNPGPTARPDKVSDTEWGKYLGYGLQVCVGVLLGLWVGNWLDHKYNWAPWGVLVGSLLGLASGMYLLIKEALKMNKD